MKPADIGSWGLLQVVQEAGRLWRQHFGDFLPAIIVCVFPASLMNVVYAQYRPRFFVSPPSVDTQGSTEEAYSVHKLAYMFLQMLMLALPEYFNLMGAAMIFGDLTNVVYSDGDVDTTPTTRHTESLFNSIDLALAIRDVETANPVLRTTTTESSLYHRIRRTSKGKKLKAIAAIFMLRIFYIPCEMVGEAFTPQAMMAMGLLPWMAFLVTLPLTVLVTLWTSYCILVHLVMFVWLCSPSSGLCNLETNFCERDERAALTGSASSYSRDEEEEVQPFDEGQAMPKDYAIPERRFVENKWRPLQK